MIPYFELRTLSIGDFQVPVLGSLMALAIIIARWRILGQGNRVAGDDRAMSTLFLVVLTSGVMTALIAKTVLEGSKGIRSVGAFFGGLAGGLIWCLLRGYSGTVLLGLLDRIAYVLPLSWMIGRLGCALVHDHLGQASQSWMAVRFADGPRYDLGVIEFGFLVMVSVLFWAVGRQPRPAGFYFGLFAIVYGGFRIWLDTLQIQPYGWDSAGGLLGVAVGVIGWAAMVMNVERQAPATAVEFIYTYQSRTRNNAG